MLARELYMEEFHTPEYSPKIEHIYGTILYREASSPFNTISLDNILNEYVRFKIKHYFGYTLDEFMKLTPYLATTIKNKAFELIEEENRTNAEIARNNELDELTGLNNE